MDLRQLEQAIQAGESETVEFKKSTAQLPRAGETLCGFFNGNGGMVVIGVGADGKIVGQDVADSTQQDIARMLDRFEPPAPVETSVLPLPRSGKSVIVLRAPRIVDARPFTYDGSSKRSSRPSRETEACKPFEGSPMSEGTVDFDRRTGAYNMIRRYNGTN